MVSGGTFSSDRPAVIDVSTGHSRTANIIVGVIIVIALIVIGLFLWWYFTRPSTQPTPPTPTPLPPVPIPTPTPLPPTPTPSSSLAPGAYTVSFGSRNLTTDGTNINLIATNTPTKWIYTSDGKIMTSTSSGPRYLNITTTGQLTVNPTATTKWNIVNSNLGYIMQPSALSAGPTTPQCLVTNGSSFGVGPCSAAAHFSFVPTPNI